MDLFGSATQLSQPQPWFNRRSGTPRLMSIGIHTMLVALALIPWTSGLPVHPKLKETAIVLYSPSDFLSKPLILPGRSGGGGGGGKDHSHAFARRTSTRSSGKQFVSLLNPEPPKNTLRLTDHGTHRRRAQLAHLRSITVLLTLVIPTVWSVRHRRDPTRATASKKKKTAMVSARAMKEWDGPWRQEPAEASPNPAAAA